jgi:hypothetical protein
MYIGQGVYRALEKSPSSRAWKNPNELPNQIKLLRTYPTIQGSAYFSSTTFQSNPNGWSDSLRNNYYSTPAMIPPMEWLPPNPNRGIPTLPSAMPSATEMPMDVRKPTKGKP